MPEQFSWAVGQYLGLKILYIYISNEGRERNERGTICYIYKKKTLTRNHLFKSSLNKSFKTQK